MKLVAKSKCICGEVETLYTVYRERVFMRLGHFYLIAVLMGMGIGARAFAVPSCGSPPSGYQSDGVVSCVPVLPSTDFGPGPSPSLPACGSGRIALSGDGTYTATTFSSSGPPLADSSNGYDYTNNGETNHYTYVSSSVPNPPIYGYPQGSRCYCKGLGTIPTATVPLPTTLLNTVTGPSGSPVPRQYPVTFDVINSQPQAGLNYAPVPIALDGISDGRLYAEFTGSGSASSACGCPNFNEKYVSNGTDSAGNWVGSYCAPMVNPSATPTDGSAMGPVTVLAAYNPNIDLANMIGSGNDVLNGSNYITTISLPNSGSDAVGLSTYTRRIWKCADPYQLNISGSSATCVFNPALHACDDGSSGSGDFPSPVSDFIGPTPSPAPSSTANKTLQFDNTVNKKLACCLNAFHSDNTDLYEKFDCLDNSRMSYTNFDALWQSSDTSTDGGQLNAIILTDGSAIGSATGAQKIISGFYSLTGQHCDQFSEFAYSPGSQITRYRVDPLVMSSQQTKIGGSGFVATGTPSPLPESAAYATINTQVTSGTWNKTVPTTRADFLSCPILVRAAIVATCPPPTLAPNALTTVDTAAGSTPRCAVAGGIQVHVRIEQIFEITGTAPAPVTDTMMQLNSTTSLDVTSIITAKVGDQCPPGTTKKGDLCAY
jgi:hypothetical protein